MTCHSYLHVAISIPVKSNDILYFKLMYERDKMTQPERERLEGR